MITQWVTVHHVHLYLDEYPWPLKGTVRTPTVASGRGYCLQTAHLGPRCPGCFARNSTNLPNYGGRKGGNPTTCWCHLDTCFSGSIQCGSFQMLSDKPRPVTSFYDGQSPAFGNPH